MDKVASEGSFQIILQSDNVEDSSEYWQDQCKYLYNDLYRVLPEGTIKPLTLEGPVSGKAVDIISFSHIVVDDFAAKCVASFFVEAIFVMFNNWSEHRLAANIKLKYPDGSTIKVSKFFFLKLLEYSKENPQLSIFQVLNHLKDFKE